MSGGWGEGGGAVLSQSSEKKPIAPTHELYTQQPKQKHLNQDTPTHQLNHVLYKS